MSDTKAFVERLIAVVDKATKDNADQLLLGGGSTFEQYRYMVGVHTTLVALRDRIIFEFQKMERELVDGKR